MLSRIKIPQILKDFNLIFEKAGYEAYLVGGAVRDIFLKQKASDWDITTNATPQEVMKLFKLVIPTGIEHGTVTVHFKKHEIEVTTFRTESDYTDGRHPDKIEYAATIDEDLSRRDFTMNAIAINLKNGKITDPFHGRKDIRKKIIRTVGNPHERFMEDGLRPVRALRFASQLNFSIEKQTYLQIFEADIQKKICSISVERFRDEFLKMMKSEKPSIGIKLMEETGILKLFIPEILECRNCIQKDARSFHIFDVMDHNIYSCDGAPKDKPLVRIAAFFHDCGKPQTKTVEAVNGQNVFHFYNHEKKSAETAEKILKELKFSNAQCEYICHLIENHMFKYTPDWSDSAVRRFLVKTGLEYVDDLFDLRLADMYGKYNEPVRLHDSAACKELIEFRERIRKIEQQKNALSVKDLAINGKDLIQNGFEPGKKLGFILHHLLDCVIEDPEMNTREKLLKIAKSFSNS
ncbi:MAG: HD domain-containing protein [Treponema sp.]|nr:HD domain-containing protein [Treponema sp.]